MCRNPIFHVLTSVKFRVMMGYYQYCITKVRVWYDMFLQYLSALVISTTDE